MGAHVVHLELLEDEWAVVQQTLCTDFGHCTPLPALPKLNSKGVSGWREAWGARIGSMIHEMLREDFEAFDYGDAPDRPSPVRPGPVILELTRMPQVPAAEPPESLAAAAQVAAASVLAPEPAVV